jgi:hypothetical protein
VTASVVVLADVNHRLNGNIYFTRRSSPIFVQSGAGESAERPKPLIARAFPGKPRSRLYRKLNCAGLQLISVSQGIESRQDQAETLLTIHGLIDSSYVRELAKKTHRSCESAVLRGLHVGGSCPNAPVLGLDLNQRPPGYEFKCAGSQNILSLAESVVLSAHYARIQPLGTRFCAHLAAKFRVTAKSASDRDYREWAVRQHPFLRNTRRTYLTATSHIAKIIQ